jgi:hypothetical protein
MTRITVEALIVIDVHGKKSLLNPPPLGSNDKIPIVSIHDILDFIFLLFKCLARDVVESLNKLRVKSDKDFNWISQLRYYWIDESINVSFFVIIFIKNLLVA